VCCKWGSQMYWCVDTNSGDGYRLQCRRITSASACPAPKSIGHGSRFQQRITWKFCSSRTTSFAHTNTIESTRWHSSFRTAAPPHVFSAGCRSDNVDQFSKLTDIVATIDWDSIPPLHRGHAAMYRRPIHHPIPVITYNTSACDVHVTTDNVSCSFAVLCAPQVTRLQYSKLQSHGV
jgi:hypothetical protein